MIKLEIVNYVIKNEKIPKGFDDYVIVHISDLHNKYFGKNNIYLINLVHTHFYFYEYEEWGADLILAGHVYGGIIRIPFIGGLLSPNRDFFPRYDFGEYNKNNSTMIVTKGLGDLRFKLE